MPERVPNPPEWVTLSHGERVRLVASPSRNLVLAGLAVGFVLLIAMSIGVGFAASLETGRAVSFATLVVIVGLLLAAYGPTRTRQYVLTSDRALAGVGLRTKRVSSVPLEAVSDVQVRQGGVRRFLGVGTVRIVTIDGDAVAFRLVGSPTEIGRHVSRLAAGTAPKTPPR